MIIFMRKKLACIFICAILVLDMMLNVTAVAATEKEVVQPPKLHAVAAALYDADEHMTIYGKNSNESMANASTTKILTCIVTLENSQLSDTVKVSGNAASQPQVALGLVEGDTYNMKDLMYGMMLESYNDCAYAIAEHVAGTVEEFAKLMNAKANEIGCYGTYFLTPNGLDKEDEVSFHHTTANDLCTIMAYCTWESPKSADFIEITRTMEYTFNGKNSSITFTNHNRLLQDTDYAVSGKTGFTTKAGYCYVAAVEKDGRRLCLALLGCGWPNNKNYKWEDAKALVEYGCNTQNTFSTAKHVAVTADGTEETQTDANSLKNKEKLARIQTSFLNYFTINLGFFY